MLEAGGRERLAKRVTEILGSFQGEGTTSDQVFSAFAELDSMPEDVVREALAQVAGPLPDPDRLDETTRRTLGLPPPRLRLRVVHTAQDADLLDLGPIAEEQLRLAARSYDGQDLAAEERLDGEVEGNLAGTIERRVLAAAGENTPVYDVILLAGDAGAVFRAGTTDLVALVAYGRVESRDRRLRSALEEVLDAPVPDEARWMPEVPPAADDLDLPPDSKTEPEIEALPPPSEPPRAKVAAPSPAPSSAPRAVKTKKKAGAEAEEKPKAKAKAAALPAATPATKTKAAAKAPGKPAPKPRAKTKPAAKPAPKPAGKAKAAAKPATKAATPTRAAAKPTTKPAKGKPAAKAPTKVAPKAAAKPAATTKAAARPAAKPVSQGKAAAKPAPKPTAKTKAKATPKAVAKPKAKATAGARGRR